MAGATISLDGKLLKWQEADLTPQMLMGCNWIYTTINTLAHKPLHLEAKLLHVAESYKALYGTKASLEPATMRREIRDLLYFGLYPEGGNTVNLYLLPRADGEGCRRLIIHEATTPYDDGYGLLTVRPKGIVANYEIPFEKHHTNVSMTAARFADSYANARGYDIALRANRAGMLLSSGDNPLFVLRGNILLTPPLGQGARPSVERELMMRVCEMAGVKVVEESIQVDELTGCEEIMVFTPVGIQSLYSLGDVRLGNIYATLLAKHLKALSLEGFVR